MAVGNILDATLLTALRAPSCAALMCGNLAWINKLFVLFALRVVVSNVQLTLEALGTSKHSAEGFNISAQYN